MAVRTFLERFGKVPQIGLQSKWWSKPQVYNVFLKDEGVGGFPKIRILSKTMKLLIHNYLDLAIEIREAMKIIQYPRVTPSTETLNNYWNPRVSSLMIIILYGSKTSKIIRKCWVSNTKLVLFCCKKRKNVFFTPWLRLEF